LSYCKAIIPTKKSIERLSTINLFKEKIAHLAYKFNAFFLSGALPACLPACLPA
jgi:hypothetical protein